MKDNPSVEVGAFVVLVAVGGGCFGAGYYKGHADAKDEPPVTQASVAPLASAVGRALSPAAGGPVTPPGDYESRQAAASARKEDALELCEKEGGVPGFGFGYSVICLKKEAVKWSFDPGFPPLSEGLK